MNALTSRKFILSLVSVLATAILCAAGIVSESIYSTVIIAVVGGYLAANVTQKATEKGPTP